MPTAKPATHVATSGVRKRLCTLPKIRGNSPSRDMANQTRAWPNWKTNKEERPEFPAYVVYLTDFSPNRKNPLERDIRIAKTEAAARQHYKRMAEQNFIGGWERVEK